MGGQTESTGQEWPVLSWVLAVADQLACFGGFLALFWHFHAIIGAIFLFATSLAYLTTWLAEWKMRSKQVASDANP